jgi:hypothetical protein
LASCTVRSATASNWALKRRLYLSKENFLMVILRFSVSVFYLVKYARWDAKERENCRRREFNKNLRHFRLN